MQMGFHVAVFHDTQSVILHMAQDRPPTCNMSELVMTDRPAGFNNAKAAFISCGVGS